ncbi:MAG: hypothetical protein EA352_05330 [Gemmatimonadales bacterium]|nr:MAG: hypothetical protein EA352_05330 [Gemmatimonadales bacterium]
MIRSSLLCQLLPSLAVPATLLLAAALLAPHEAGAQTIRGTVVSAEDGRPVSQARIQVVPADEAGAATPVASTTTGRDGSFSVWAREPGVYRLQVESLGFDALLSREFVLQANEVRSVELRLEVDAVELSAVEVTGRRWEPDFMGDVRRRQALGMGTVYTREDLEARSGARIQDILQGTPGLRVVNEPYGGRVGVESNRGLAGALGQPCFSSIYVDGWRVFDVGIHADDEGVPRADLVDHVREVLEGGADQVEAIEVYRGVAALPAEFGGSSSQCGVVAVWTRRGQGPDTFGSGVTGLQYAVRLALGASSHGLSGDAAPRHATGLDAAAHWSIRPRISLGAHLRHGQHAMSAETLSEVVEGMPALGPVRSGPLRMTTLAVEPRVTPFPEWRIQPVLQGRLLLARRSFEMRQVGGEGSADPSSLGVGLGAGVAAAVSLPGRLGLEAGLVRDRISFEAYPDLTEASQSRWSSTGAQIRLTWDVAPVRP